MSEEQPVAIETFIQGSEKLLQVFGYWPSFHDAEIINFHLWRGNVDPEKKIYQFAVLTLDLRHWELTNEIDATGHFVLQHHTRTTLIFRDVMTVQMSGFNHQNAIFGLSVKRLERENLPPYFAVEIEAAFGMEATFTCLSVEVAASVPSKDAGEPLP